MWQICHIHRQIFLWCWWRESKRDIWPSIRHGVLLSNINCIQFFRFMWKDTSSWTFQLQRAGAIFAVPPHGKRHRRRRQLRVTAGLPAGFMMFFTTQLLPVILFYFYPEDNGGAKMIWEAACLLHVKSTFSFRLRLKNRFAVQNFHRWKSGCSNWFIINTAGQTGVCLAIHQARGQNRTHVYGL